MSTGTNELAGLLGDKYTPTTHDYCLSNRRSSHSKKLEGWFTAGEMTNHGEVMIVLARLKPSLPTPAPVPPPVVKPTAAPAAAKPSVSQRVFSTVTGGKK